MFDLGYYDYAWWAELDAAGCRIVTRFKSNTPLRGARDMPLDPGSAVLSDRIGFLPAATSEKSQESDAGRVREIVVMRRPARRLRLLSNDLDAPAQEIADLYKRRWGSSCSSARLSRRCRITQFVGSSENAVRIQIAVALIAFFSCTCCTR